MTVEVSIRPFALGDAEALLEAVRESVPDVSVWMPWCYPGYSLEDARGFLQSAANGWEQGGQFDFAILARDRIAGACGINRVNVQDRVANLGYWVRSSCAGRGMATQAVRMLLDWASSHTNLNRIEIVAAVDNRASQRVAEKVGARRDAVLAKRTMVLGRPSDAVLYSVLRVD